MNSKLNLRSARNDEAPFLTSIAARSKAHWPYDQAYLTLCAEATRIAPGDIQDWHFAVAELDGRVIGFSGVAPVKGEFMLDHLWIEPEFIGKGFGALLFDDAMTKARAMGWTKLLIAADPYAEQFYSKMGAKRVGERESKIRSGFFLPLMEHDLGLTLIGDGRIKSVEVKECGEAIVDLSLRFSELNFDFDRNQVQKDSQSISLARISVGKRLVTAQSLLPAGMRLFIKECYRPMWVQKRFWDSYSSYLRKKFPQWTDEEIYDECSKLNAPLDVAPHTTGGAVDLTLTNANGEILEMGTQFNASPLETNQATYTASENISKEARKNREILMRVMSKAGFVNYPTEWWHWTYGDKYWANVTGEKFAIYSSQEIHK